MPAPLRLAILECGDPPPQAAHTTGSYGAYFRALFARAVAPRALDAELSITVHDVVTPTHPYPAPGSVDAVLLTGSKHDAFADAPWILALVRYVRGLLLAAGPDAPVRVVGVCFGHQIVARALGAAVVRGADGWEVGVVPVRLTGRGPAVFRDDGDGDGDGDKGLRIHQMHRDLVPALPAGAELLASTAACRVQAFLVPGRALAVQGHPEFTAPLAREILETRRAAGVHSEALYRSGLARADLPHDGERIARAFLRFMRGEGG
ncbi:hypothetical protein P8C59_000811 [Phyllachora maydis]|uniref:Glutamine amidotransferase domain-containing protein n=1 Tax=Phyllachora maydis TaxID=1825666 RepID=A0AAD9HYF8_9PEZI|nr:hypothetical protein P8C59_000811 [Phyllachora maydis]